MLINLNKLLLFKRLSNNNFKQLRLKSTIIKEYSPLKECINVVKRRDYENYLCLLLIKDNKLKRFGLALRALNAELSSIKDQAKSREIAQFRFLYWTQSIDSLFKKDHYPPINEPITTELKKCIELIDYKLSIKWFKRLIDSRKNNQNNFPFSTTQELEQYQEQSVSPIYYLLIEYAIRLNLFDNIKNLNKIRIDLDHIASHLGQSQGILNLLRGLYRNALIEECFIPNDLLIKHNLAHEGYV